MFSLLLAPFGLGLPELLIILGLALLIFGGAKLPAVGRGLGQAISEFKKGMREGESSPDKPKEEPKSPS